jgi:ribosome-associated protein
MHAVRVSHDLRLTPAITIPAAELSWQFSRSSGPGGQGVNTADSRAELRFDLARTHALPTHLRERALRRLQHRLVDGVLVITASEFRSQLANRRAALARLTSLLLDGIAPPARPRRPTRPSKRAAQARLEAKRQRGEIKRLRRNPPDG